MKALLLKDFYVLRKQMWVYAIIVLAWGVVPQAWLNLLAVVYGSIIPYSAMAYDQRSRWDKFTRMLPYSDQAAVMSRYVLGWIFILASAAIVMLSQGILSQLSIPSAFFSALPLRILFVALCIASARKKPVWSLHSLRFSSLPPQALSAGWQTPRAPLPLC